MKTLTLKCITCTSHQEYNSKQHYAKDANYVCTLQVPCSFWAYRAQECFEWVYQGQCATTTKGQCMLCKSEAAQGGFPRVLVTQK